MGGHVLSAFQLSEFGNAPKWKRLGLDFPVAADLSVWLIEINHRSGMGAPRGPRGDMLHSLVARFYQAERCLRGWRMNVNCERIGGDGVGMDTQCRAFGFRRLDVPSWKF